MRLYRNALILIVVLAVALGAFYFLKDRVSRNEDGSTYIPPKSEKLLDFSSLDVTKLSIKYPDEELVLVKIDDENWQLESDKDLNIENSRVRSIAIRMSSVFIEKEIEEDPKDLGVYGLDQPVIATAWLKDGTVYTIKIGNQTPTKSAYYAMLPDVNKVYTISNYDAEGMLVTKNSLKKTALYEVVADDFIQLSLERNGALAFDAVKEDNDWMLTYPLHAKANITKIYEISMAISQFYVTSFEQDSSDLSVFGLDKPRYVLSFKTSNYENSILFGKEIGGTQIYAKLGNRDDVFKLDVSSVNFLDVPIEEVVESFVALPYIQDVNKVVVTIDGRTDVSEIMTDPEDSDNDKFTFNGKDASVKDEKGNFYFKKYYQGLLTAGIRDEVDIYGKPEGEPEVTIIYYKKDGEEIKLEFISRDDFYYYILRNGEYTGLVVNKKKLTNDESLRATREKLVEAMNNQGQ